MSKLPDGFVLLPDGPVRSDNLKQIEDDRVVPLLAALLYVIPQIDEAKRALADRIGERPW